MVRWMDKKVIRPEWHNIYRYPTPSRIGMNITVFEVHHLDFAVISYLSMLSMFVYQYYQYVAFEVVVPVWAPYRYFC